MLQRAATVVVCLATAGCGWMFPDDRDVPDAVREQFAQTADMPGVPGEDCDILLDQIRKVASAPDPNGSDNEFSWWVAPTDSGGSWDFVFQLDPDGKPVGGSGGGGGCVAVDENDEITWTGGGGSDSEVSHGGRVPEGSASVRLYFEGHEADPAIADVQGGGYYFVVLGESACCEYSFPDTIEALDTDGGVIASTHP